MARDGRYRETFRYLTWCAVWGIGCFTLLLGCQSRSVYSGARRPGVYHEVKRGQTLWSIAQAYAIDLDTLLRVNNLAKTHILEVGEQLYIPGAAQQRQVVSRCPCDAVASKPTATRSVESVPARREGTSQAAREKGTVAVKTLPPQGNNDPQHPSPPEKDAILAAADLRFIWPLQGTITRGFEQDAEQRHDGIDIAAPQGSLIRAAADGDVLFSDWGPGGYGRIVILRHKADFVTVYAHNHRNYVRQGQYVPQGEVIASVGQSGRATGYHLHFEMRRKTVAVSPFQFLPHPRHIALLQQR